jgi:hypothetical protein
MSEIICRRCSIGRVNLLCRLYDQAYGDQNPKALGDLNKLLRLAAGRGYPQGQRAVTDGMDRAKARQIFWNVSSVLTDRDFELLGYTL